LLFVTFLQHDYEHRRLDGPVLVACAPAYVCA
jgi:hypothetical protein